MQHTKQSTAAHISGDTLMKCIISARFPVNWRGTSYAFVLHWKEQVSKYEKLELAEIPPKQKRIMLKNTVAAVNELQSVKQIEDQSIARGEPPIGWEEYLEFLLSSCSQDDKAHTTTRPTHRNVYATNLEYDEDCFASQDYTSYGIDTDIMEIYANATHTTKPDNTSQLIPWDKWLQLTQKQRDATLDKQRKENSNPSGGGTRPKPPMRRFNTHTTKDHVNMDEIIEYTFNTHLLQETNAGEDTKSESDMLIVHMSGQSTSVEGTSPGDIRHVLAARQDNASKKGKCPGKHSVHHS
jgi:hypothetical protein